MAMSMFDDIEIIWRYGAPAEPRIDVEEAIDRLVDLSEQFNALAPDWADAPEWAQWYTIDMDGFAYWRVSEPVFDKLAWKHTNRWERTASVDLPVGIDSRLCKWQRPEVTA
jgi:hypothetical protein